MRDAGDYHRSGGHLAEDTDDRAGEMEGIAMNESDCKLITEKLLGECWHEPRGASMSSNHGPSLQECRKCGEDVTPYVFGDPNRTFQDPQDFFACFEKLVERGKWDVFVRFATSNYTPLAHYNSWRFMQWLLSRTESGHYRLCMLVAEWLTAQEEGV
jgi:hypothetical protein